MNGSRNNTQKTLSHTEILTDIGESERERERCKAKEEAVSQSANCTKYKVKNYEKIAFDNSSPIALEGDTTVFCSSLNGKHLSNDA